MNTNTMEPGLEILNCGEGHLTITFKKDDLMEVERAKRIISDMLRRGYALFITGGDGVLTRVKRFKADTGTYLIADGPVIAPVPIAPEEPLTTPIVRRKRGRPPTREVPMTKARATVIGRSAGG